LGSLSAEELDRFSVTSDDVSRLAGALVRAGALTPYQAAALSQGKGRGLLIGNYLIQDKLGEGGMGVVFRARHRPTGHQVALKVLSPSFGRDREAVLRFRREGEVASRLDHPNVVAILDASEDRGVNFMTMEDVSGHDLDHLIRDGGPMPVDLALHCVIHAARGLAAAHALGIIHRDVKPANVMLDAAGSVRVLDLGVARVIEASNAMGGSLAESLTRAGAIVGTVDFMAPEQADDPRKVDHRADIYSLGCTLYFLLTGRPPFLGDTVLKRLLAHHEQPVPSLRAARPEVSEALEGTCLEMMAKVPADRPRSMDEVIDALEVCRSIPENDKQDRAGLTAFTRKALKRATPRGRDRGPEASIFARRDESRGLMFDPDLRLEHLVMDYREEHHPEPPAEEKLPPKPPRPVRARAKPRRRSPALVWWALALLGIGLAGYRLVAPRTVTKLVDGPKPAPVQTLAAYAELIQAAQAAALLKDWDLAVQKLDACARDLLWLGVGISPATMPTSGFPGEPRGGPDPARNRAILREPRVPPGWQEPRRRDP
jgi:serine/threonine protein kinase